MWPKPLEIGQCALQNMHCPGFGAQKPDAERRLRNVREIGMRIGWHARLLGDAFEMPGAQTAPRVFKINIARCARRARPRWRRPQWHCHFGASGFPGASMYSKNLSPITQLPRASGCTPSGSRPGRRDRRAGRRTECGRSHRQLPRPSQKWSAQNIGCKASDIRKGIHDWPCLVRL